MLGDDFFLFELCEGWIGVWVFWVVENGVGVFGFGDDGGFNE